MGSNLDKAVHVSASLFPSPIMLTWGPTRGAEKASGAAEKRRRAAEVTLRLGAWEESDPLATSLTLPLISNHFSVSVLRPH